MTSKISFLFTLAVFVSLLLTGCMCTNAVVSGLNERSVDVLVNPTAVYRHIDSTNNFALEGNRKNHFYHDKAPYHAYVFIPDYLLDRSHLQKTNVLSLENVVEIAKIKSENFPDENLASTKKLSRSYIKVASLPENNISLEVEVHYPKAYCAPLLPFAIVADVVSFPIQAILKYPWVYSEN
jgi:hypothetical protein